MSGGEAGGLIGAANSGSISDSWATGNIFGGDAGGLVGFDPGAAIKHSWASGQVSGYYGGGLIGEDLGASIEQSHASGAVTCQSACGGLVGRQEEAFSGVRISQSYATGTVTSAGEYGSAGGLVGSEEDLEIWNSYALGAVTGSSAGGLVGENIGMPFKSISRSYATGAVVGRGLTGGLIGFDGTPGTKRTYWDMTTSGITDPGQGAGNVANDPGITGLSDAQLKSGLPKGFDPRIWNEDPNINGGLPYLIANPPQK